MWLRTFICERYLFWGSSGGETDEWRNNLCIAAAMGRTTMRHPQSFGDFAAWWPRGHKIGSYTTEMQQKLQVHRRSLCPLESSSIIPRISAGCHRKIKTCDMHVSGWNRVIEQGARRHQGWVQLPGHFGWTLKTYDGYMASSTSNGPAITGFLTDCGCKWV